MKTYRIESHPDSGAQPNLAKPLLKCSSSTERKTTLPVKMLRMAPSLETMPGFIKSGKHETDLFWHVIRRLFPKLRFYETE